jgi:hypothetical protein
MKILLLGLALLFLTACESAPKEESESTPVKDTRGAGEKKTTFGKGVQSARDLNSASEARGRDVERQLQEGAE